MLVTIAPGRCTIDGANHYPGYGPVRTVRGLEVAILGAPRWYRMPPTGAAADCVGAVVPESARAAALVTGLCAEPDVRRWGDFLTGNFLLVVHCPAMRSCVIVTDLGNSFHCYRAEDPARGITVFGTNVDAVAGAVGRSHAVDVVSLAEYVVQTSMTYPYTAYEGVTEVPFASSITCAYGMTPLQITTAPYWTPRCASGEESRDLPTLARALRDGVLDAMERLLAGHRNVALLLSGGTDSRALAGILQHLGVSATALTMADARNTEVEIAERIARVSGLRHEIWLRDAEYYPRLLDDFLALEGPHATFTRAVHFGFRDALRARGFDAMVGGYMSDSILKVHEANAIAASFLGRNLGPIERMDQSDPARRRGGDVALQQWSRCLRPEMLAAIRQRRQHSMAWWEAIRGDGSAWEWRWLWPFSRNQFNPHLTTGIFVHPVYEVFTERAVIEVARVAAQVLKINGRLFNTAMRPFYRATRAIPLAVTRMRIAYPWQVHEALVSAKHLLPRRWMFRPRTDDATQHPVATDGSWPNLDRLWTTSRLLEEYRRAYDADALDRMLLLPSTRGVFDVHRYDGIPHGAVRHAMYYFLHLDRWRKRVRQV